MEALQWRPAACGNRERAKGASVHPMLFGLPGMCVCVCVFCIIVLCCVVLCCGLSSSVPISEPLNTRKDAFEEWQNAMRKKPEDSHAPSSSSSSNGGNENFLQQMRQDLDATSVNQRMQIWQINVEKAAKVRGPKRKTHVMIAFVCLFVCSVHFFFW